MCIEVKTMKKKTKKKLKAEAMNEDSLDQVNGGSRNWTPKDSDPRQIDQDDNPTEDSFFGPFTLFKPNSAENELKKEKLSETENVPRVRSNNIRNRRV